MIAVRFPDGTAITYNEAQYITTYATHYLLTKDKDGVNWIAKVPLSCLIESTAPCKISNPIKQPSDMAQFVLDHLREIPGAKLSQLKRALADFNIRSRRWK